MSSSTTHPPGTEPSRGDTQTPLPPDRAPEETPGAQPRPAARPIGLGLVLISAGALWLLSLGGVQVHWQLALPIAIIAIGLVLLVGGRHVAHSGLAGLGIALTVVALVISVTPMQSASPPGTESTRSLT